MTRLIAIALRQTRRPITATMVGIIALSALTAALGAFWWLGPQGVAIYAVTLLTGTLSAYDNG